jgi:hypothetical protein
MYVNTRTCIVSERGQRLERKLERSISVHKEHSL